MDLIDLSLGNNQPTNQFQQLVFLYNAVMNGWTVKQIGDGLYELEKNLADIPTKYKNQYGNDVKESFIYKFLKNNLSLECGINQPQRLGF